MSENNKSTNRSLGYGTFGLFLVGALLVIVRMLGGRNQNEERPGFGDNLVVELFGEELDDFTANDHLEDYRREFSGDSASWIGRHQPTDEGTGDPENMVDWRICYDIEMV